MVEKENKVFDIREGTIKRNLDEIRPPAEIRDELDYDYSFESNTLILFEVRPYFQDPSKIIKTEFVKAKFIKKYSVWKIYWQRGSGRWDVYEPMQEVETLDEVFTIAKDDEYGCFFG